MPLYDSVEDLTLVVERVEHEPHVLPLKHSTRRTTGSMAFRAARDPYPPKGLWIPAGPQCRDGLVARQS